MNPEFKEFRIRGSQQPDKLSRGARGVFIAYLFTAFISLCILAYWAN